ncbi:hypothetical protein PENTCL1PPCAC_21347 [Pristionchus entomophagus]|uniref:Glutathione S-transferase n=1 Tax=Pristionchus entomophagus TaxID=358040 RepID=A0AAV5TYA5_9BILA|nr:hypothetical protein PENTCL1PPCAC_21347 [Pristionchus entomophagus]
MWIAALLLALLGFGLSQVYRKLHGKKTPSLLKKDWKKQHVYMVQYPRCRTLPNLSPWSLKLETWLRIADIPFTNINSEFTKFSSKGQVPFVELNGRTIDDSNFIIEALKQEFGKTDLEPTDAKAQSAARAFSALAEEHLTWALFALRSNTKDGLAFASTDDGWGRYIGTGLKRRFVKLIMGRANKKLVTDRANAQGMGRHTPDELHHIAKEDLKAISAFLGDKPFFGGDWPTTLDATMFGHLASLIYIPTPEGILTNCITVTYPNLGQFVERIKEKFWPDWEETCRTMDMNAHHKKE